MKPEPQPHALQINVANTTGLRGVDIWVWFCLPFLTFWHCAKACSILQKEQSVVDRLQRLTKMQFEEVALVPTSTVIGTNINK